MMSAAKPLRISGWGRYPNAVCNVARPSRTDDILGDLAEAETVIARGCGRSYGDASLNPNLTLVMSRMNRILNFDSTSGLIECEAGVTLSDLIEIFLPRGFVVPVTPGTHRVTIGGMISADVHGKNHHGQGSFCDHVEGLDLLIGPGRILRCSRDSNCDLFEAACGGMGLAGTIVRATFRMKRIETAFIRQRTLKASNLEAAFQSFEDTAGWTYSVAWLDGLARGDKLGRSVLFLGEHAKSSELPRRFAHTGSAPVHQSKARVPFDLPAFALSAAAIRPFNASYWRLQREGARIADFMSYFYPLDSIEGWNRLYGRRGFVQYQCLLPLESSARGLREILLATSEFGSGSFLTVLKRMGEQSFGMLSFPMPGYTLTMDFPVSRANLAMLNRLDAIAVDYGGRIYLAKDARASPRTIEAGYARLQEFREVRRKYDLDRFSSLLSRRLEI